MSIMNYLYNLATDKYKGPVASVLKLVLLMLSLVYGAIIRILIFFSHLKPAVLHCKVISVGNITLGGTGKTVLVENIARYLKQEGHKVAIVSRGYKRKIPQYAIRPPQTVGGRPPMQYGRRNTQYEKMGDEPYMLQMNLKDVPVIVDADRQRGANSAIARFGIDTVIFDDGFQQWRIKKNLEIVTVDARSAFGNKHMIPRGILREPLSSLKRANIFVLTNVDVNSQVEGLKTFLLRINPSCLLVESRHLPSCLYDMRNPDTLLDIERLKGKTVSLISGIGNPDSFEEAVKRTGATIALSYRFPDHHYYSPKELDEIMKESQEKHIDALVTTEKDFARLLSFPVSRYPCLSGRQALPVLVLRIALTFITDEQGFYNRLRRL